MSELSQLDVSVVQLTVVLVGQSVSLLPNAGTLPLVVTLQYPEVSIHKHFVSISFRYTKARHRYTYPSSRTYSLLLFFFSKAEPVRPIDPAAWISHTTALTGSYPQNGTVFSF